MCKQSLDRTLTVLIELAHLLTCVALGHDGQVDAGSDVGFAIKRTLGRHEVAVPRIV